MNHKNLLSIGDFSRLAQVSIRALRHYDELELLKPEQTDEETAYRYYSIHQLPRLYRIRSLMDSGLSLHEIANFIQESSAGDTISLLLAEKNREIEMQIEEFQKRRKRLITRIQYIDKFKCKDAPDVIIKQVACQTIVSILVPLPYTIPLPLQRAGYFDYLYGHAASFGIPEQNLEMVLHHGQEKAMAGGVEFGSSIDLKAQVGLEQSDLKAHPRIYVLSGHSSVASLILEGAGIETMQAIEDLRNWAKISGYRVAGPLRELHLSGRENSLNSIKSSIIELQLPLSP